MLGAKIGKMGMHKMLIEGKMSRVIPFFREEVFTVSPLECEFFSEMP